MKEDTKKIKYGYPKFTDDVVGKTLTLRKWDDVWKEFQGDIFNRIKINFVSYGSKFGKPFKVDNQSNNLVFSEDRNCGYPPEAFEEYKAKRYIESEHGYLYFKETNEKEEKEKIKYIYPKTTEDMIGQTLTLRSWEDMFEEFGEGNILKVNRGMRCDEQEWRNLFPFFTIDRLVAHGFMNKDSRYILPPEAFEEYKALRVPEGKQTKEESLMDQFFNDPYFEKAVNADWFDVDIAAIKFAQKKGEIKETDKFSDMDKEQRDVLTANRLQKLLRGEPSPMFTIFSNNETLKEALNNFRLSEISWKNHSMDFNSAKEQFLKEETADQTYNQSWIEKHSQAIINTKYPMDQ